MNRKSSNREPLSPQPFIDDPAIEPERYELFEQPRYAFDLDRRDFFKVVGGGLIVCLLLDEAEALQQGGRRRGRGGGNVPQELGAWLHISETGEASVFTGKTEVGQDIRTSLAQAVAEELRLPVESIRMVMADTDLVPYDGGTSGSRTTPSMSPQLRKAAAAAREMLLDLAAEQLKTERGSLVVSDGKVSDRTGRQSATFGSLTKGQRLTKTVTADPQLTPATDWKVLGTSVPKIEGRAVVTGRHRYASDVQLPGLLHGKVLRPPTLGSTLASVDLESAKKLPGVTVVRDGSFVGVAAPNPDLAEQAVAMIRAQWNTPPQASGKDLFSDLKRGSGQGGRAGGKSASGDGPIADALAAAAYKTEATYTIAYIAHTPLEPRAAVAEWKDDKLTVWTGSQRPFGIRGDLAEAFGVPEARIRVIVPDTGSGYGGKHTNDAAIEAARLAKAAGKPVKLVWTREEEFTWAYFRPAGVIDVAAGVSSDGLLTAWDFHNYNSGGSSIRPLYEIAHERSEFHGAQAPLRQGSYRALAAMANHFARESTIDDLAKAASTDPLEFRLKNLKDARLRAVFEAAAKKFGWDQGPLPAGRGRGIAGGNDKGSYVATCAEIEFDRSDKLRVVRLVTAFECGAIINPDHLQNQVEGGVTMGLGGALFEAIEFDQGQILNASLSEYRVPRFSDVPILETVLLDRKDIPSVGAGETPIVAVAPAIANAIFQLTGRRLRSLPMNASGLKV